MPAKTIFISAALAILACGCNRNRNGEPQDDRDTLVLAVMPEQPPYAYMDDKTGDVCGIDIDIVKAAARKIGKPLEIRRVAFDGLMPAVKNHTADFAAGAITIIEGRKRDGNYSDPYSVEGSSFIYKTGKTAPTMTNASSMNVGVIEGMTHDFYLTRHGIDPIRYKSIDEALLDMDKGSLDTVFYDRTALVHFAAEAGGKYSVTPYETREYYGILVRKDRPDYLEAVNKAISERQRR